MYETFYKLDKKPFQLVPDPEFFFNSAVHKRALAYLRYGLAQGEGFIVVTGMPGTGKTMLVKELFEEIRHEDVVAGLMVTTHVDPEDTLRIVSATFGLPHDGPKASLLNSLEIFFREQAKQGRRVLLVVDEAQNLPPQSLEELRMLSNFEANGRSFFQSFLLGQDDFRDLLQSENMEQVRQRVTATYHLRPFDRNETEEYIVHRLQKAGWKQNPKFTDAAYEKIFAASTGVPRKVNLLCDRLLLYGFLEELSELDENSVQLVVKELESDSGKDAKSASTHTSVASMAPSAPMASSPSVANGDLESRIQYLEATVESLRQTIQKERALLRKAVLIQLDMDEIYDE